MSASSGNSRLQAQQQEHRGVQQQRLLESVVDVQQMGSWLLAARAQDVTLIDTRCGRTRVLPG
jgi:hypothetical protein